VRWMKAIVGNKLDLSILIYHALSPYSVIGKSTSSGTSCGVWGPADTRFMPRHHMLYKLKSLID